MHACVTRRTAGALGAPACIRSPQQARDRDGARADAQFRDGNVMTRRHVVEVITVVFHAMVSSRPQSVPYEVEQLWLPCGKVK